MRTIQDSGSADNDGSHDSTDDQVVIALTTWPDEDDAVAAVARRLVEGGLAACVTRLPRHRVTYRWQGAIEEAEEHQWVIKTTRHALPALWEAVRAAHPYETPEWLVLDVAGGSDAYLQWVRANTSI
ncbi:divalent-cation tolerance protein CutA [Luteitalea sp. TBR-22]|uniref:divalent-cation tolerance protein CutA n=1 Tax=Luteitalea sp. TBR-22 TaxID=2802971 RepID=UPI001AFBAABC|nr:divalent-cation tolerance protein CutA [Luteitalea sp. TBR-22]BCS33773.1 divalent-cation tolerance protein CutA [Luteitalea sp. TBR-22]